MPYDAEERTAENRKLEALVTIGTAIGALSSNLTIMLRENMNQTSLLKRVESKLVRVLVKLGVSEREAPAQGGFEDVERE